MGYIDLEGGGLLGELSAAREGLRTWMSRRFHASHQAFRQFFYCRTDLPCPCSTPASKYPFPRRSSKYPFPWASAREGWKWMVCLPNFPEVEVSLLPVPPSSSRVHQAYRHLPPSPAPEPDIHVKSFSRFCGRRHCSRSLIRWHVAPCKFLAF